MTQPSHQPTDRRRRTSREEMLALRALAVAGGLVALTLPAQPTGIGLVDSAYLAATGAALVLAGSRSRRWTWIASTLASLWFATDLRNLSLALIALGFAVVSVRWGRRRWLGAAVALPLVLVLGDLGPGSFHGSTGLLALAIASPMLMSAVLHLTDTGRQGVVAVFTVAAALVVFAVVVFGAAAFLALGDVSTGIDEARAGFDLAADGDEAAAAERFDVAAEDFRSARRILGGPWMLPVRLVPVVGQHARAGQVMVSEGVSLSETAADVSRSVDPDTIRLVGGRIDLAAVDALAAPLDRAERALARAATRVDDARDAWLVGPVDQRLEELGDRLDQALPAARTAALAAAEAPVLLGRDGPVRWLVLLTTPAEARGLGGLVGNYATVVADGGAVRVESVGRNEDVNARLREAGATLIGPEDYVERWGRFRPQEFFQDVTLSPDLPSVATVAASLFEQGFGDPIDGVIVADPFVVGAVLQLTGPVSVGDRSLGPEAAVEFLVRGQYEEFEDDEAGRVLLLEGLVLATFDALTSQSLPGPRGIAAELGPMVDQDRLGAWWIAGGSPTELLAAAGLDGRFPDPDGGDLIAVVHQNRGQNKIDAYLERSVNYRTVRTGNRIEGTIAVTLANTAPATGLPDAVIASNDQGLAPGTNAMNLSIYTALEILEVRVAGVAVDIARQRELGVEVVTFPVDIDARSEVVVEVDVAALIDDPDRLTVVHQPLVNDDTLSVTPETPGSAPAQGTRVQRTDTVIDIGS